MGGCAAEWGRTNIVREGGDPALGSCHLSTLFVTLDGDEAKNKVEMGDIGGWWGCRDGGNSG